MSLTEAERNLIERLVCEGPSALADVGMSPAQQADFMLRADVRATLEQVSAELGHRDMLDALARFIGKRKLSKLIPRAVDVLESALEGPTYLLDDVIDSRTGLAMKLPRRDLNGNPIIQSPEPTPVQVRAAVEVLDRLGLAGTNRPTPERVPNVNLSTLLSRATDEAPALPEPDSASREQQSLSREKVRNVIELLRDSVIEAVKGDTAKQLRGTVAGTRKVPVRRKKTVAGTGKKAKAAHGRPKAKARKARS